MMSSSNNLPSYEDAKVSMYAVGSHRLRWQQQNRIKATKGIPCKEFKHDPRWRTETVRMAHRIGITQDNLDNLSVIHVAGTKGKGSTCHFVESILLSLGYKVGLFSSPHVFEETERIRINGRGISQESFANNFWYCYNKLTETKMEHNEEMPSWFQCLTLMGICVFMHEQVDVAIMETGIGGEYDSTNVFRCPVVCGITMLDLDHTSTLGETLAEIAWHKAGIFKHGVPAYTVMQPEKAMEVLKERAREKQCNLKVVPSLKDYDFGGEEITLGIQGDVQRINASLAMQLCKEWIDRRTIAVGNKTIQVLGQIDDHATQNLPPAAPPFVVPSEMKQGLEQCFCPGRSHVINLPGQTFYTDVAHTPKSVQESLAWFSKVSKHECKGDNVVRIGMVSLSAGRDPLVIMDRFLASEVDFDYIVFCPSYFKDEAMYKGYKSIGIDVMNLDNVTNMESACQKLLAERSKGNAMENVHSKDDAQSGGQKCSDRRQDNCVTKLTRPKLVALYDLNEAIYWVTGGRDSGIPVPTSQSLDIPEDVKNARHISVLVTCSFRLVANVLRAVEPSIMDNYQ